MPFAANDWSNKKTFSSGAVGPRMMGLFENWNADTDDTKKKRTEIKRSILFILSNIVATLMSRRMEQSSIRGHNRCIPYGSHLLPFHESSIRYRQQTSRRESRR